MKNTDDVTTPIRVVAAERANLDYHHGALRPAVGAQNFQVLRANRDASGPDGQAGWTYNHAPMLAHWHGRFYLHYLSNPIEEHAGPGRTLLVTSDDGRVWSAPRILFPVYEIPFSRNEVYRAVASDLPRHAIMHQRMGFHVARNGRLLALGFYGFSPTVDTLPFDERGIGRVVREIRRDSSWGPVYFIHYNRHAGWTEENTLYPFYRVSDDPGFIAACDSLLADHLVVQQWKEEHGDSDERIRLKGNYKALSYYTLADGRVVGLWKWSLAGISSDRGASWDWVGEVPTIANAGGKIWGQRTCDGRYALVYNPSTNNKMRWPLAVVTSGDGLTFSEMLHVAGEVSPRRYLGGQYKDYGHNYVRGIAEGNGTPPDNAMWVAYSMNKEDIWVARVPVPIRGKVDEPVEDDFSGIPAGGFAEGWNVHSPVWSPVEIEAFPAPGERSLKLTDGDPWEYAKVERVFPATTDVVVEIRVMVAAIAQKPMFVEVWSCSGQIPVRVIFDLDRSIKVHHGRGMDRVGEFVIGEWHELCVSLDAPCGRFDVMLDGKLTGTQQNYMGQSPGYHRRYGLAPVETVERVVFRTGPLRREPTIDTDILHGTDLQGAGTQLPASVFYIKRLRVSAPKQRSFRRSDGNELCDPAVQI